MSPNAGREGEGVAESQSMSTAVHIGAQTNFGDPTPYLTYEFPHLWGGGGGTIITPLGANRPPGGRGGGPLR